MHIAIEGVIGVGKTSLARLLQPLFKAGLLLEAFEENPFLSNFYQDRERYAFQTQIFFLLSRYRQLKESSHSPAAEGHLIADYTFAKDALFARLNLRGDELDTYHLVYEALAERILTPDLVVYLQVDTTIAMERIAKRDRSYERSMDETYIQAINDAYRDHFAAMPRERYLPVDTNEMDFVAHREDLGRIVNEIRRTLGIPPFQPELPFDGALSP